MNYLHSQAMKYTAFLLGLILLFPSGLRANERLSVQKLYDTGKVDLQIIGLGGHTGFCVSMKLMSTSAERLHVWIEPGRRLVSEDPFNQDILIVKEIKLELDPGESKSVEIFGFCCQSQLASPSPGSIFFIGFMAPKEWIELAEFMNTKNFDLQDIQMAVWVLSDDHHPASVCSANNNVTALRRKIAEIRRDSDPWYCIIYERDDSLLFSNKHLNLSGNLSFVVKHYCTITIQIRSESGKLMKTLARELPYQEGSYSFEINQNIKGWSKGKYEILVLEDHSNLIFKTGFKL